MAGVEHDASTCGCGTKPVVVEFSCGICYTQVRKILVAKDHPLTWGLPTDELQAFGSQHMGPRVFVLGPMTRQLMETGYSE